MGDTSLLTVVMCTGLLASSLVTIWEDVELCSRSLAEECWVDDGVVVVVDVVVVVAVVIVGTLAENIAALMH